MAQNEKCAHRGCECMAQADGKYCSEYCEDAEDAGIIEIRCGCEHAACR